MRKTCSSFYLLISIVLLSGFTLRSSAFPDNGSIPEIYTCSGMNISPDLTWSDVPKKTKSFALTVIDTTKNVVHWVIYNIPADSLHLEEGVAKTTNLPDGAMQGINYLKNVGYDGPCPPKRETHTYAFTLYALDSMLALEPRSTYS